MRFNTGHPLLQHALDFLIYLLSFCSNIIIIVLAPDDALKDFAKIYLIGNIVFSLLVYYQFTNSVNIKNIKLIFIISILCLFISFGLNLSKITIYFFYPYFYLISDYLVSQKFQKKFIRYFRVLSLITLIPFIFSRLGFDLSLTLRTVFFILAGSIFLYSNSRISKLLVTSRWTFVLFCYLSYSLPLYLIIFFARDANELKFWYISTQAGIAIILKYYDFSSRGDGKNYYIIYIFTFFSFIIPLLVLPFYFNLVLAFIYWLGFLCALYAGKFVRNEDRFD